MCLFLFVCFNTVRAFQLDHTLIIFKRPLLVRAQNHKTWPFSMPLVGWPMTVKGTCNDLLILLSLFSSLGISL